MKKYLPRIYDKIISEKLETFGAIWVVGPKFCGKTKTAEENSKSHVKINEFSEDEIKYKINPNPNFILDGNRPRLIDEWQLAPHIWDIVKIKCDENTTPGKFILTGSTSVIPEVSHSGTGRIATVQMYPMSLYESKESNGSISLLDLFNNKYQPSVSTLTLEQLIFSACRGGWPLSLLATSKEKMLDIAKNYYYDIYTKDIKLLKDFNAKSTIMKKVLQAYARNVSTLAKNNTIYDDADIDRSTFNDYLELLKKLYIVEELEPWPYHLRSKDAMRSGNKREFVDPSIAVCALKATPQILKEDLNTFGFIFETLCIRDLRVYANALGAEYYYFHDKTGLECDCIIQLSDGRYCLVEIKLGPARINEGVINLNTIENLISRYNKNPKNKTKIRTPSFKMVLTNVECSSIQEGGVYIIPIGCLKD